MTQLDEVIANQQQRSNLQQQQRGLEAEREGNRGIIEQLLAAAYVQGRSGAIRTFLNQEDNSESSCILHYKRIFGNYQLQR